VLLRVVPSCLAGLRRVLYNILMRFRNKESLMRRSVIAGNVIFVLWILYNGMNEGWKATLVQLVVYIILIVLLLLSSFMLISKLNRL
jgi:hypothetical protein